MRIFYREDKRTFVQTEVLFNWLKLLYKYNTIMDNNYYASQSTH